MVAVNANAYREHYGEKCGQQSNVIAFSCSASSVKFIHSIFLYTTIMLFPTPKSEDCGAAAFIFLVFIHFFNLTARCPASAYPKTPEYRQPFSAITPGF